MPWPPSSSFFHKLANLILFSNALNLLTHIDKGIGYGTVFIIFICANRRCTYFFSSNTLLQTQRPHTPFLKGQHFDQWRRKSPKLNDCPTEKCPSVVPWIFMVRVPWAKPSTFPGVRSLFRTWEEQHLKMYMETYSSECSKTFASTQTFD